MLYGIFSLHSGGGATLEGLRLRGCHVSTICVVGTPTTGNTCGKPRHFRFEFRGGGVGVGGTLGGYGGVWWLAGFRTFGGGTQLGVRVII